MDVVDFGMALWRQDVAEAGIIGGTALLPGSSRLWRGVGGEVVEYAGKHLDEAAAAIDRLCSFSAETLVMTEDGLIPISEVTLRTLVLAYNEETGEIGYYPVVAIWSHEDPVIVFLTIDGETIVTTPNHPFFTSEGEWEQAGNLQPGDEIRDAAWGTGTVESVTFTATPQTMYNFTVAIANTYFVGDGQWLVHNDNLCNRIQKSIRSLEINIVEYEQKLADWLANPDAYDHNGWLQNVSPDIRQRIIDGRARHLQHEIDNWRTQLKQLEDQLRNLGD